ncbi:MAG TPA: hypothetical protein VNG51_11780 [Ktedonobacteraceae bacterium]|nr:hypothetical protein [Ktedonobacteraceae bacterium]
MLFCGQCGLQLAPGSTACPRCGSVTQPALPPLDNPHSDDLTIKSDPRLPLQQPPIALDNPYSEDPTIASDPGLPQYPPRTPFPQSPGYSPISPTPGSSNPYPMGYAPGTPTPSPLPTERVSHPGIPGYPNNIPPGSVDYSTQHMQDTRFPPQGNLNYPPSTPGYTDFARAGDVPPLQEQPPAKRNKGGFVFFLLALLIIASAVTIFFLKPTWLFGNPNTPQTPSITGTTASATATATLTATPTSGPSGVQQAQATAQSYYTDINNRDYQSAYNLWLSYPQSEAQFANGFTNTIQDSLTITSASQLPDGTVQVFITLVAQNTTGTTTYSGYYIIQLHNGSWMIQRGHLA